MRIFRRLMAVSAAAIVAMASGVLVAHADSTPTVYNTPGGHISGDRLWKTTCEMYSTDVVRCHAEIWATQVSYVNGRYVQKSAWTFNNLTYLPSPRESWSKNGLGGYGIYGFLGEWQSDGRTWKTECDTATTGGGGCRGYILAKHVRAKKAGSTWFYSIVEDWVFNNLVLFSGPTVPPVSTVPNWIVDCPGQWIEPKGLRCGPLRLGSNGDDLTRLGYMSKRYGICGEYWVDSKSVKNRGVRLGVRGNVQDVSVSTNFIRTEIGARVGMTVGQVKALYGAAFKVVPKENYDGTQYFGTYREGAFELQFRVNGKFLGVEDGVKNYEFAPTKPLVDSDVIVEITGQRYTDNVWMDGC